MSEISTLKESMETYSSLVGNVSNTFSIVLELTEKNEMMMTEAMMIYYISTSTRLRKQDINILKMEKITNPLDKIYKK